MDDDVVTALEAAIADLGTLLVQMQKFRAAEAAEARDLHAACLAIGDRARRAHRQGALDAALASELHADADAARATLEAWLATVRTSAPHRAAVEALGADDDACLQASWVTLFAGVVEADVPPVLFHPVAWQRRGRPRPPSELADELVRLRADGLSGDDDPAAPGVDPALPGVLLHPTPPLGAPIALVLRGDARPRFVLSLVASGDLIVPAARLRTPFAVHLASPDDEDLDAWTLDPAAYRRGLADALAARGLPIDPEEK